MKTFFTALCFIGTVSYSQVHTTTGSGNFFNPLLWDCFCVPGNGDSLVVNHSMTLNASIYYNSGQILINPSGSLIEDAMDRDVWIDGTGSLINHGTFDCYRLYVSEGEFTNTSNAVYFDSLLNQGNILNSGKMTVYDILNDQAGSFSNSGEFTVENNFANQGFFFNSLTGTVDVTVDYLNCNIQTDYAILDNDGVFCIGQDFSNCLDDTLTGTGDYFVAGSAINLGVFHDSFTFNTPSGSIGGTGSEGPGIVLGNASCYLTVPLVESDLKSYPNPVNDLIYFSAPVHSCVISDLSGKLVTSYEGSTVELQVSHLQSGIYFITVQTENGRYVTLKFIKQ